MKVEAVKDVTTQQSPITYQVTVRLTITDMGKPAALKQELFEKVMAAIGGLQ